LLSFCCSCCCQFVSIVVDRSLGENASDNEVFNSTAPSPSFRSEVRLRRATVGCELSTGMQSCLSTGDIPSLVDHRAARKSRPKTFFECSGNELMDWNQLLKLDSSDLSERAPKAGIFQTSLSIMFTYLLSPPSERSEWRRYCFCSMCVCLSACLCVCLCTTDRSIRPV